MTEYRTHLTNSACLLSMARIAHNYGTNRQVDVQRLEAEIDPDGIHVAGWNFQHNDKEMRAQWLCKIKDKVAPVYLWLDVPIEDFRRLTVKDLALLPELKPLTCL